MFLAIGLVGSAMSLTLADEPQAAADRAVFDRLAAGKLRIVDLTYSLNATSAYWPGPNYEPFRLQTIATLDKDGVLSKSFSMPEHLGTHLDAPNHFERNQPSVEKIPPEQFFAAGVVIDVSAAVSMNEDYQLTAADITAWETEHGPIPRHAVVLLRTGWGRHWKNVVRYQNRDVQGRLHFPGYSAEAARLLIEGRQVKGIGIDTLSIDYGLSREFAVHHIVNAAARYGLENVAQLDQLPAKGFYLVVAPIKIEDGSGGPTRILAILP